jgi:hypothetical protein
VALDLSEVKRRLQDHLCEGLLIVIGSGLSIAEDIPGMWDLAQHLLQNIPARLADAPDPEWAKIAFALNAGDDLESAMSRVNLLASTFEAILEESARLISAAEQKVFERALAGHRELPLTPFMKHLFKAGKKFHVITTNYDRLVEFAAEAAEIGVDSRFFGYLFGRSDPKRSADAHRESYITGKSSQFRNLPCLCVHKPHGSLDWFEVAGKIARCPVNRAEVPIIITPGATKYRESFRWAFDDQRNAGNRAAASATRLMFIGYGFNDEHLEQYMCPNLRLSKPTVIVTKKLSDNAKRVLENSREAQVITLSEVSELDLRTRIANQTGEELVVDEQLWNLDGFNQGVL